MIDSISIEYEQQLDEYGYLANICHIEVIVCIEYNIFHVSHICQMPISDDISQIFVLFHMVRVNFESEKISTVEPLLENPSYVGTYHATKNPGC